MSIGKNDTNVRWTEGQANWGADEDIEADSIRVPIEAEFKIMGDVLGVKGRTVCGLGAFPQMEANISTTVFSRASNS